MTSLVSSTTQIIPWSLLCETQISQVCTSDILKQFLQYLISFFKRSKDSVKRNTSPSGCFNKCSTRRRAVFLPTPGSLANSSTACPNNFDENSILQNY